MTDYMAESGQNQTSTGLVRYDAACRAVAEAKSLDEAKDIRDKAEAMRAYARQAKNRQLEVDAAEIRIRAERRVGELMAMQRETVGLAPAGRPTKIGLQQNPISKHEPPKPASLPTLAEAGIDKNLADRARKYAAVPEPKFNAMVDKWRERVGNENTRVTTNLMKAGEKELRKQAKQAVVVDLPEDMPPPEERFQLIHSDLSSAVIEPDSIDCIITDPPYPQEFLPTFTALAEVAAFWLKPGGSLLVMSGQSWLPEVMRRLTEVDGLSYHWTLAYLTPGGQSVQVWPRKVNTFWKPVIWLVKGAYSGYWAGDVAKSNVNDNDKRFHHWGQSESGMAELIERVSVVGDTVLDPFCGGGTTGVTALAMGRKFIGIDIDEKAIETTRARLIEAV